MERKFVAIADHRSANDYNRNLLHYFTDFQKQVRFLSLLVISNRYVSQIFYGMLCYKGSEMRISVVGFLCLFLTDGAQNDGMMNMEFNMCLYFSFQ